MLLVWYLEVQLCFQHRVLLRLVKVVECEGEGVAAKRQVESEVDVECQLVFGSR